MIGEVLTNTNKRFWAVGVLPAVFVGGVVVFTIPQSTSLTAPFTQGRRE
jgi:hypothetical protein